MTVSDNVDHYEVLQVSARADQDTIDRVFRHLAKRFHPDNVESGDTDRFREIMEAFRVLSNPELRAAYDAGYERRRETRWRIFNQESVTDEVSADRQVREAVLSILYAARRRDAERPGLGMLELEELLGCPEEHLRFHVWYLKENGWLQRLENGMLAITASGVDRVLEQGGPAPIGKPRLRAVNGDKHG